MTLVKLNSVNVDSLNIGSSKDNTYIQIDKSIVELQSGWLTLDTYPLPSKKYLDDNTKILNMTIPIQSGSKEYNFFKMIDSFVDYKSLVNNKTLHKILKTNDVNNNYIKAKIYLNTGLYVGTERKSIADLHDFYNYLKEGTKIRIVFGFSKMWKMGTNYGFNVSLKRIQLDETSEITEPEVKQITFLDD
jgi:hypothetical protein